MSPMSHGKTKFIVFPTRATCRPRTGEAKIEEFVLLVQGKEQDEKTLEGLFSAVARARAAKEKPRTTSP